MLRPAFGHAAEREARDLVAAVLEQPRHWPSTSAATRLGEVEQGRVLAAAARRRAGAPLAYAVGTAAFRHLLLGVDERVLIPRPETEYLIDVVLGTPQGKGGGLAVDIGTGSGAIALALAGEGPFSRVVATDISNDALAVARANAARCASSLRCSVEFRAGDALAPLHDMAHEVDAIVSNPPYIAFAEARELPPSVRDWEPPQALICPEDGMAVSGVIVAGGWKLLRPGGLLAFETDARRAGRLADLVRRHGAYEDVRVIPDLAGRDRFVLATRRS
ncbi:MAG: peptide chain release factor N(5)-glutamine methyltransferase [Gemmatimonadaceae bacterium]|nr:peptide chain release factor N(5)-glutamine methyltransferase [Gemmatimonadaceae bacterium]